MARPRKNTAERPLSMQANDLLTETENAQESAKNSGQDELPFDLESYGVMPTRLDSSSFLVCASADIEARHGVMELLTGIILKDGYHALVMPTVDNTIHGLPTETDYRLSHSRLIPIHTMDKVKVLLSIDDETKIQEQTSFGSRSRNIIIPKGTPLAKLVVFKL